MSGHTVHCSVSDSIKPVSNKAIPEEMHRQWREASELNWSTDLSFLLSSLAISKPLLASPLFYCDKTQRHVPWIPTGSFLDSLLLFVCYRPDKMIFALLVCFVLAEMARMSKLILSPVLPLDHSAFFCIPHPTLACAKQRAGECKMIIGGSQAEGRRVHTSSHWTKHQEIMGCGRWDAFAEMWHFIIL